MNTNLQALMTVATIKHSASGCRCGFPFARRKGEHAGPHRGCYNPICEVCRHAKQADAPSGQEGK